MAQSSSAKPRPCRSFSMLRPTGRRRDGRIAHSTRTSQGRPTPLHRLGLRPGRVVAYVLPNLPETHFTIWGAEAAGIAFAINPLLDPTAIRELLRTAGAEIVVTLAPTPGSDLWPRVRTALLDLPGIREVVWTSLAPYVPIAKRVALRAIAARERFRRRRCGYRISDLRRLMARESASALTSGRNIAAQDAASYFCTGGTTGLPKIAVRSHRCEVFDSWALGACVHDRDESPPIVLCGLPLFHVNAQLVTGLQVWIYGGTVLLATPQGYRGQNVIACLWDILAHHGVTTFSGVPTLYAALLQTDPAGHDIGALRYVACGAAPMPAELLRRFEQRIGVPMIEGYGLTEAGCVSAINLVGGTRRAGTIGHRLPYQPMRIVILDHDGRYLRSADTDEPGTVVVRGPNLFEGYLGSDAPDVWIEIAGERWLNTGDLGRQDDDGYFRLVGRTKELIIRGGHNIDPKAIEDALMKHPAVILAAAVGRPDRHAGEVPVAYVELVVDAEVDSTDLEAFARAHIGERASVPKTVTALVSLPKTAIGKIHKPQLVCREIENVIRFDLAREGIGIQAVKVEQDRHRGYLARISLSDQNAEARAAIAVGEYTFGCVFE